MLISTWFVTAISVFVGILITFVFSLWIRVWRLIVMLVFSFDLLVVSACFGIKMSVCGFIVIASSCWA